MINLTNEEFIGKGFHRKTYYNPENKNVCIKVLHANNDDALVQLNREIAHNLALQNKHKNLKGIAKYLGTVETNLGKGYVFELIKDVDTGMVSESLESYLLRSAFLEDAGKKLYYALLNLKNNMLNFEIIPMEMYPGNVLCQKNNDCFELVIIDDIGTASFIPIEYYFSFAANNRIKRRFGRFLEHIVKLNNHPLILDITNKLK